MTLDSFSQTGFTFDTGMFYMPSKSLTLGANIQNLISDIYGNTDDQMPVVVRLGAGYKLLGDKILMALDLDRSFGAGAPVDSYAVGFEGRINDMLCLRLGKNQDEVTAGFGITYNKTIKLDYAIGSDFLGSSQRISMNYKFGKSLEDEIIAKQSKQPKIIIEELLQAPTAPVVTPQEEETKEELQAKFREAYQAAVALYKKGLYTQALDSFTLAQKVDPTDPDVPIYIERLKLVTPIVPQNILNDKATVLERRGITYFMEGNGEAAVKTIAYALSTEPDNFTLSRLLARIEEKTGFKAEYTKPVSGM